MTVMGAEVKHGSRAVPAGFAVLAVGVAASLALASYAVTTSGSAGRAEPIASPSASASPARIALLGPSASLPGADAARLTLYGKAITAHHPPAIDWQAVLGPSASLPGASVAQLKRYGQALAPR